MRLFEITLLASIFISFLLINRSRKFLAIPAVIAIAQFVIEGYRWQLIPAYALAFICLLMAFSKPPKKNFWSITFWIFLYLTLVVGVALPFLLPIPMPSAPTGPFSVGTTTFYFVDENRVDPYAPEPGSPREILVQVWYPSEDIEGYPIAPWMQNADLLARGVSEWLELAPFMLDQLVYANSHARIDQPALKAGAPFPVVLFSHGYGGFRAQNTFQAQELASQGYIVAGVEHTYASVLTVFPDGRIAKHNEDTLLDGDDFEPSFEALVSQWANDLSFTLNSLAELSKSNDNILSGKISFDKVVAMGHSTGGGAALQYCFQDDRCSSAFGMDPALASLNDDLILSGYPKPYLLLFSEVWATGRDNSDLANLIRNSTSDFASFYIEGTAHYDFSDLPAATPLAHALGLKGPINGDRVLKIINEVTLAYIGEELRNIDADWLSSPGLVYPEIIEYSP